MRVFLWNKISMTWSEICKLLHLVFLKVFFHFAMNLMVVQQGTAMDGYEKISNQSKIKLIIFEQPPIVIACPRLICIYAK